MSQEILETSEMLEIKKATSDIVECAENLMIIEQSDRKAVAEFLITIKKLKNIIKVARNEFQKPFYKKYLWYKSYFDEKEKPVLEAEAIAKNKESAFLIAEENRIKKEQEEIDRKARIEEERKRKELEERAKKWAEKGNQEKADQLFEQSQNVFTPSAIITPIEKSTQIEGGMTTAKDDIEIVSVDLGMIVKAIASGDLPFTLVDINLGAVKKYMKSMFGNVDKSFNGIMVKKIKGIAIRRERYE
jgi:hypothetical protein